MKKAELRKFLDLRNARKLNEKVIVVHRVGADTVEKPKRTRKPKGEKNEK